MSLSRNLLFSDQAFAAPTVADPDAQAYLKAVCAEGVRVSVGKALHINAYCVDAKSAGYFDDLSRVYLPVWGNAQANSICMVTRLKGKFHGTVTHGDGWIQGDGSTGYLDMGASPAELGIIERFSGALGVVIHEVNGGATERAIMGAYERISVNDLEQSLAEGRVAFRIAVGGGESVVGEIGEYDSKQPTSGLIGRIAYGMERFGDNLQMTMYDNGVNPIAFDSPDCEPSEVIECEPPDPTPPGFECPPIIEIQCSRRVAASPFNMYALAENQGGTAALHSNDKVGALVVSAGGFDTARLRALWVNTTGIALDWIWNEEPISMP